MWKQTEKTTILLAVAYPATLQLFQSCRYVFSPLYCSLAVTKLMELSPCLNVHLQNFDIHYALLLDRFCDRQ
ncbi:hypothetical protein Y032_0051g2141 [Ancylostoma ceylanicum]|uniref:Uncharacterized protein n=1 Tax=Ancylostoma ceylanicum TaxID=53326 RepID=A0A016U7L2_9BILA|nr:hypothetical protein Y032_0051g2141 [Ancylostoma ceylanicum]